MVELGRVRIELLVNDVGTADDEGHSWYEKEMEQDDAY